VKQAFQMQLWRGSGIRGIAAAQKQTLRDSMNRCLGYQFPIFKGNLRAMAISLIALFFLNTCSNNLFTTS
jgi:hypothetical protein